MIQIYQNLLKEYKKIKKDDDESIRRFQDKLYGKFIIDINRGDMTLKEIDLISHLIIEVVIKDDITPVLK